MRIVDNIDQNRGSRKSLPRSAWSTKRHNVIGFAFVTLIRNCRTVHYWYKIIWGPEKKPGNYSNWVVKFDEVVIRRGDRTYDLLDTWLVGNAVKQEKRV